MGKTDDQIRETILESKHTKDEKDVLAVLKEMGV
jgi:hypothetical protein